jgi:hypothetical protein
MRHGDSPAGDAVARRISKVGCARNPIGSAVSINLSAANDFKALSNVGFHTSFDSINNSFSQVIADTYCG